MREWTHRPGAKNLWPITYAWDYAISHRDDGLHVFYRETGEFVGKAETIDEAKSLVERHANDLGHS